MTLSYCINYFFKIMNEKNSFGLDICFGEKNNPFELFKEWFDEAKKTELNDPNAVALGTVDSKGHSSVRMVLLKNFNNNSKGIISKKEIENYLENLNKSLSLVEKVKKFKLITEEFNIQTKDIKLSKGDVVLLCTDGLYNELGEEYLKKKLQEGISAETLVSEVLLQEPKDNITAIIINII